MGASTVPAIGAPGPLRLSGELPVDTWPRWAHVLTMTTDERLDRLEEALTTLGEIVEQRSGCFAHDQQPTVQILGERFEAFRETVAAHRYLIR